ncbi:MAG: hypothetical protein QM650_05960 [Microlunatus sp.]
MNRPRYVLGSSQFKQQLKASSIQSRPHLIDPSLAQSRSTLCRALDSLTSQVEAFTVIGSHAVHERTRSLPIESTSTKDADLAITPELATGEPSISAKMREAGFRPLAEIARGLPTGHRGKRWESRPGLWGTDIAVDGSPVDELDLLVPEALAGGRGRSAKTLPAHGKAMIGRVDGIELAVLERDLIELEDFTSGTARPAYVARVSGIICAKAYKITDRLDSGRDARVFNVPKDAVDLWRCLSVGNPDSARAEFDRHGGDQRWGPAIQEGLVRTRRVLTDPAIVAMVSRRLPGHGLSEEQVEATFQPWREAFSR